MENEMQDMSGPEIATSSASDAATAPAPGDETVVWIMGPPDRDATIAHLFKGQQIRFLDPGDLAFPSHLKSVLQEPKGAGSIVITPRTPASIRRKVADAPLSRIFVEDGFIRGPGLPGRTNPSYAYIIDNAAPYYDLETPSELELTLNTYDFEGDVILMQRARALRDEIVEHGVTKYAFGQIKTRPEGYFRNGEGSNVVVLGHFSSARQFDAANVNGLVIEDVIKVAFDEHPDGNVLLKAHPLEAALTAEAQAILLDRFPRLSILPTDMALGQILSWANHVVTIASQGGFEAALRGIPVTVLGSPFYAGWGFTDDRASPKRRERELTPEHIVAAAYIKHSVYLDPHTAQALTPEDVLQVMRGSQRVEINPTDPSNTELLSLARIGAGQADPVLDLLIPAKSFAPLDQKDPLLQTKLELHQSAQAAQYPERVSPVVVVSPVRSSTHRLLDSLALPTITIDAGLMASGVERNGPIYSYLISRLAPHYNSEAPSDLEAALQTYDFTENPELMERSARLQEQFLKENLSSVNFIPATVDIQAMLGQRTRKRVLILAQGAADPALQTANPLGLNVESLLRIARRENPGCHCIILPDPTDITSRKLSTDAAAKLAGTTVVEKAVPLTRMLAEVDHVYTISAKYGFEAILRGVPLTVLGAPFYAGWGIADDRAAPTRRSRMLTIEQVFAAAYVLQPKYVDPVLKSEISAEQAFQLISDEVRQRDLDAIVGKAPIEQRLLLLMRPEEATAVKVVMQGAQFDFLDYRAENFAQSLTTQIAKKPPHNVIVHRGILSSAQRVVRSSKQKILSSSEGFLCVTHPGDSAAQLRSIIVDDLAPHYDMNHESRLEKILTEYDFAADKVLLSRARALMKLVIKHHLTKHPQPASEKNLDYFFGAHKGSRVLVLGHRETDSALALANPQNFTNAELVAIAQRQHPGAQIIFKPHPGSVAAGIVVSNLPEGINLLDQDIGLPATLVGVDQVYTVASLGGFEAAMRGIKTTVLGSPFYAGWGLTDDWHSSSRRQRTLTAEEIFAAAYILYPKYLDPLTRQVIQAEVAVANTIADLERAKAGRTAAAPVALTKAAADIAKSDFKILPAASGKAVGTAFAFSCGEWRAETIRTYFPDYDIYLNIVPPQDRASFRFTPAYRQLLDAFTSKIIINWGVDKDFAGVVPYARSAGTPIVRVEDGFIRGSGLGAEKALPLSLAIDDVGMYFDSSKASQLEYLFNNCNFDGEKALLRRAREAMDRMISSSLTKYNLDAAGFTLENRLGPKSRRRILVIGQVEGDASIAFGCKRRIDNNGLVTLAALENPDAEIIYKPHPDVIRGNRKQLSDPANVASIATILTDLVPISHCFDTIDHVYTITSLAGFEALMRGLPVTTFGAPFYSGWGLTDDRQATPRRRRKLTLVQIFAGAYLKYMQYRNPITGEKCELENALDFIGWSKSTAVPILAKDEQSPSVATNHLRIARKRQDEGDSEAAIREVNSAIGADRLNSTLYRTKAKFLQDAGVISNEVIDAYEAAIKLSPKGDINSLIDLVKFMWRKSGVTKELVNTHLADLQKYRDALSPENLLYLAAIYVDAGYISRAVKIYQTLSTKSPAVIAQNCHLYAHWQVGKRNASLIPDYEHIAACMEWVGQHRNRFEQLCRESAATIAVVGNSPVELGTGNGAAIDAHQHVMRFNNYSTDSRFSADYGKKTNIWVKTGYFEHVRRRPGEHYQLVLHPSEHALHKDTQGADLVSPFMDDGVPINFVPRTVTYELYDKLRCAPSAGISVLYWMYLISGKLDRSTLFGFSFIDQNAGENTSYSGNTGGGKFHHNWQGERDLFENITMDAVKK